MSEPIFIPVSVGELIDKITILEIKAERIADSAKLARIAGELGLLQQIRAVALKGASDQLASLGAELKQINGRIWDLEDEIRECERQRRFDQHFVNIARQVYRTNDNRADVKRRINDLLGSVIVEEKSYSSY